MFVRALGLPRYPLPVAVQLSLFESESPAGPPSPPGRVLVARGALAAEAAVLDRLAELLDAARQDPSLLGLPVRVVVPSRSLRSRLASRDSGERLGVAVGMDPIEEASHQGSRVVSECSGLIW